MVEDETYTIESADGTETTVRLPAGLAEVFSEEDEEPVDVLGEFVVQAFAQQTHAVVHHAEGDVPPRLADLNERMEELFEEQLGISFADAIGHSH